MARLISKNGYLLTLMFPLTKYGDRTPPNVSAVEDYHKVLDPYFDKVYQDDNPVSTANRKGYEAIGLWKLKSTPTSN
ncbi:hypothetical protein H4R34_005019 [Dimargaris verticillata]|uniref:Uncharacterized protein n=1 Tax=Dimargaris verticillata TaxID=2761393 RepID=A0A9W8B3R5_9FUNG|nr:hypothetical protein H4R34_005019 [Dimargaris verticillata]